MLWGKSSGNKRSDQKRKGQRFILVDGNVPVTDEEAIEFARALASLEGVFAGFSAGANACAAIKLLQGEAKGKDVVILISDSGLKYLSTDLFE